MLKTYTNEPLAPEPKNESVGASEITPELVSADKDVRSVQSISGTTPPYDVSVSPDTPNEHVDDTLQAQNETELADNTQLAAEPETGPADQVQTLPPESGEQLAEADGTALGSENTNDAAQPEPQPTYPNELAEALPMTDGTVPTEPAQSDSAAVAPDLTKEILATEDVDSTLPSGDEDSTNQNPILTPATEPTSEPALDGSDFTPTDEPAVEPELEKPIALAPPDGVQALDNAETDHEATIAELESQIASENTVTTSVDTSTLFEKDDTPPFIVQSPKQSTPLRKKLIVIFSVLLLLLIGGSVLASTNQKNEKDSSNTTTPATVSEDYYSSGTDNISTGSTPAETSTVSTATPTTSAASNATSATSIQPSSTPAPTTASTTPATAPKAPTAPTPAPTPTPTAPVKTYKTYTISYSSSRCFSPSKLTIANGDSVKYTNNSNQYMWPITGNHPTHSLLPELNSRKNISPGGSYIVTLNKVGTWSYHNEAKLKCGGSIIVKA